MRGTETLFINTKKCMSWPVHWNQYKGSYKDKNRSKNSCRLPGKHWLQPDRGKVLCHNFDTIVIKKHCPRFLCNWKKVPTCKLLAALTEKTDFPWEVDILQRILKELGFMWKKCVPIKGNSWWTGGRNI